MDPINSEKDTVSNETDSGTFGRRGYLRLAGAAAGGLFASGTALGAEKAGATVDGISFDRTVDAVDDLGCDPNGNEPIDSELQSVLSDGTLVEFPEGEYLIRNRHVLSGGTFGLRGSGDVRFVAPSGYNDDLFVSSPGSPADQVLFKNIDIDIREQNTSAGLKFYTRNGLHVENVEYLGRGTHSSSSVVKAFSVGVLNSDATGVLKNCVATKGSTWYGYKAGDGRTGIGVYGPHQGTLRIIDCEMMEFGNNGIYASRNGGSVQVEGGIYRNNNAAGVRISGDGSYVDSAVIEVDPDKYEGPRKDKNSGFALRGFIAEQKLNRSSMNKPPGVEVRNCDIVIKDNPSGVSPAIQSKYTGKTLTVKNTRVRHDVDGQPAIRRDGQLQNKARRPSGNPRWMKLENVSIVGAGANSAAVLVADADDSVVRDCCFQLTGSGRDGIKVVDSDSCVVENATLNVEGTEVVTKNCSVSSSGITSDGSCPAPDLSGGSSDAPDDEDGSDAPSDGGEPSASGDSHVVAFVSEEGASGAKYDFTANGPVEFTEASYESPSGNPIEGGTWSSVDYIDQSGDQWNAGGGTGGGYGDAFLVDGPVSSVDLHSNALWIELDGEAVTPEELIEQTASEESDTSNDSSDLVAFLTNEDSSRAMYDFTAGGQVEFTEAPYESPSGNAIEGGTWSSIDYIEQSGEEWQAGGGTGGGYGDAYLVDGPINSVDIDSDVMWIELNGDEVTPEELIERTASEESGDQNSDADEGQALTITAEDGVAEYEFVVSGDVLADSDATSADSDDAIDRSSVRGRVDDDSDTYLFSGEVTGFLLAGDATVTVDGTELPADSITELDHEVVVNDGDSETTTYAIEVAGEVIQLETPGQDQIDDGRIDGTVTGDTDRYAFSGAVTSFQTDGDLSITFGR